MKPKKPPANKPEYTPEQKIIEQEMRRKGWKPPDEKEKQKPHEPEFL